MCRVKLIDKRADEVFESLLLSIGEVEVEIEQGLIRKTLHMFNDTGAEDSLATSRHATKP